MKRRLIILGFALVAIIGFFAWWSYEHSFQRLSVILDPQVKSADIFPNEGEGHVPESDDPIKALSSSQEFKLKKGSYVLVTKTSGSLASQTVYFELQDTKVNLTVSPGYTEQELKSLLVSEQVLINQTFNSKYSNASAGYAVQNGQLFRRGEWFGAVLVPAGTTQDTLRFVMQKKDGKWTVVTDPPEIVLSSMVYPDTPKEILQAVNSLQ